MSRRNWMSWLGGSTVLALTPELLAACGANERSSGADGSGGRGGVGPTGGSSGGVTTAGGAAGANAGGAGGQASLGFEPSDGTLEIFDSWGERTVDEQSLTQILAQWRLTVDGLVETPTALTFGELAHFPRQDQVTDFHCVEGWSVLDVPWNGVHLSTLLELVRPLETATHVTLHGFGGTYVESLPLDIALEPRSILAYGVGGSTLPLAHGFPLRFVVPRLFGYKSIKYVYRIELAEAPVNGYWVERGYPYDANVQENRLRPGKY